MRGPHSTLMQHMPNQRGFSMIELMIATTLGLIVLAGVTGIFSSTIGASSTILKTTQVTQDVRAAMEFMSRDIRRSGYYSGDPWVNVNPFQDELAVGNPDSCLLYAYDAQQDGVLQAGDQMGFRLIGNALQVRRAGAACNAAGSWENITDPNTLKVNSLKFTQAAVFCTNVTTDIHADCLGQIQNVGDIFATTFDVTIELTAALASDPAVSVTKKQVVRVKNESVTRK